MYDVIVIGGGYAGMAAALQLVRARRKVLIVDAGQRRNRFAAHSHGFLGQDGVDPAAIAATARQQLQAYPTLSWVEGLVAQASGHRDYFSVTLQDGTTHRGRRLLFATGVADELPKIDGLAERWGKYVHHCPYCHGYELEQGQIGVIASGALSIHQAQLIPEWGETTFLLNDVLTLDDEVRTMFAGRGVTIEPTPIVRIEGEADVLLADGRQLSFAGLFVASKCAPATPVAAQMGCALEDTMMGVQIKVNEAKETTIPGVFACGDVARMPHSVSLAVADCAWAGMQLHRSLVWPDH